MTFHARNLFLGTNGGIAANTLTDVPVSLELAALAESVNPPVAVMDVTRQLRGRDTLVDSLTEPGDNRVHLLHGLGGSGKTSIAAEVARRVSAQGVTVWWVSAADRATLVSGMHAVAQLVNASTDELRPGEAAGILWRRLSTWSTPWLLVVDNADDPGVLDETADGDLVAGRGWIRPFLNRNGLVIVTSRRGGDSAQWGNWIVPHPVKMLNPADGAQVLFDHTGGRGGTQAAAEALAERLGGLSLALTLAGSYLAQSVSDPWLEPTAITTFDAFRAALDDGRVDVLEPAGDDEPGEQDSRALIGGIWRLAVRLLESRGLSLAGPFMRLLSQFANAPLPYQLMLDRETLVGSPIFAGLDHTQIRSLLKDTANLDLIDLPHATPTPADGEPPVLRVHPLMRDASHRYQDESDGDDEYLVLAARLLIAAASDESEDTLRDYRRWPTWQVIAPHAFHLARVFFSLPGVDLSLVERVAHVANLAARYLYHRGFRSQAKVEYEALYRSCSDRLGVEHPQTLVVRHGNSFLLADSGEYAQAQAELEAILDVRRRIFGEEHPDTLSVRHNLAYMLRDRGDLAAARTGLEAVLAARCRILGDEHLDTLNTRNSLANVLFGFDEFDAARDELGIVLAGRRRILGDDHPDVWNARNNLAVVLKNCGDFVAAQAEMEAVLTAMRQVLGGEHPDTLTVRQNLAGLLYELGDLGAARAEYEDVLAVQRRIFDEEFNEVLGVRHNLAVVNFKLGRHVAAEAEMRAVLAVEERVLGSAHPWTRRSRRILKEMRQAMSGARRPVLWHGPGKRKKKKKR